MKKYLYHLESTFNPHSTYTIYSNERKLKKFKIFFMANKQEVAMRVCWL